mmetsp:Transcript_31968/g.80753  ORF Transcript_31968/g.80753 Transcript_31968/m.80753 type:complete len:283 (-) Transcript_31968:593-1441(-)
MPGTPTPSRAKDGSVRGGWLWGRGWRSVSARGIPLVAVHRLQRDGGRGVLRLEALEEVQLEQRIQQHRHKRHKEVDHVALGLHVPMLRQQVDQRGPALLRVVAHHDVGHQDDDKGLAGVADARDRAVRHGEQLGAALVVGGEDAEDERAGEGVLAEVAEALLIVPARLLLHLLRKLPQVLRHLLVVQRRRAAQRNLHLHPCLLLVHLVCALHLLRVRHLKGTGVGLQQVARDGVDQNQTRGGSRHNWRAKEDACKLDGFLRVVAVSLGFLFLQPHRILLRHE